MGTEKIKTAIRKIGHRGSSYEGEDSVEDEDTSSEDSVDDEVIDSSWELSLAVIASDSLRDPKPVS